MIELRFTTCSRFVNRFVEYVTMAEYSHVEVVIPNGWSGTLPFGYLGALPGTGVQLRDPCYPMGPNAKFLFGAVETTAEQEREIYKFLFSQIGKPYDYFSIAGMFFDRDWSNTNKRWFCSELVGAAFHTARPLFNIEMHPGRVNPGEILCNPLVKIQKPMV